MSAMLETSGLTMRFGGVVAVDRVDMKINEGELRCLIGPNGAGKSTFFKCLTGQYKPTAGTIRLRDQDVTGWDSFAIARRGVGIKTQVPSVFDGISVRDSVLISARRRYGAALARSRTDDVLNRIGIQDIAGKPIGLLSHGSRQLVELATVVASEPDLIILDEPTAGMTAEETSRTASLIRQLNERHAIVVVEHDMQFIRSIAKTVTVFHQGRILIEDRVEVVMNDPTVRDVYLGKDPIRPAAGRVMA
ncbi:MAG TPA: ABC transporter ATP-binding protein [Geminicoccus sp.]|jgi:branched-chain amino acid transport system ATP-binding protein/urea transport system ATP-binding protein|uniref:ABC transporter ATP-binding protein n=1 Tax=Geminicoccus sp. TaxID=2024832 RepID=UPI002E2F6190|nr:ABC transporter ATP-binding protein [Geminicoccus sp.]HEX2528426.1 ABC transporter ATP-binding protein [Geminicoccus sp.]